MNETEVAVILALANGHDQRHGTDDIKVQAWYSLLSQECPEMTVGWAREQINKHYGRTTEMLMPAHLVTQWKRQRDYIRDRYSLPRGAGTPMPDWFKDQIRQVGQE
jgi:hypothetical protein